MGTTRMAYRSCLDENRAPVVVDTSVVINLNATGCPAAILQSLPNRCVVVENVWRELQAGLRTGRGDAAALAALVDQRLVGQAQLGNTGLSDFVSLVSGRAAETLDDGEAATVACAVEMDAIAVIDERKAVRICAERYPNLTLGCTVDLLAQRNVQAVLGHGLADAVFNALDRGRMHVPDQYGRWVVDLIGEERAAGCRSLPKRFRRGRLPS